MSNGCLALASQDHFVTLTGNSRAAALRPVAALVVVATTIRKAAVDRAVMDIACCHLSARAIDN